MNAYNRNRTKLYRQTPRGRFSHYKRNSKQRGIKFNLTFDQFMKYWQKECWYCGYVLKTIGLDRINSGNGYIRGNVRSACRYCNAGKSDLSTARFLELCANVSKKHSLLRLDNAAH